MDPSSVGSASKLDVLGHVSHGAEAVATLAVFFDPFIRCVGTDRSVMSIQLPAELKET